MQKCLFLKILQDKGITLNKDKFQIDLATFEFFGILISKDVIKPKTPKLQDFLDAETPARHRGKFSRAKQFKWRNNYEKKRKWRKNYE